MGHGLRGRGASQGGARAWAPRGAWTEGAGRSAGPVCRLVGGSLFIRCRRGASLRQPGTARSRRGLISYTNTRGRPWARVGAWAGWGGTASREGGWAEAASWQAWEGQGEARPCPRA